MNVFDLSAKILLDTDDYIKGLNTASSQTGTFGSKLTSALGTAGKVAVGVITAVASAVVALSAEMAKGIKETAEYGDNIDKMSQKMGISAEAYQEWDFILQHAGSSIDSMSRGMQTLQKNAVNSADKFEKLGISQEKLASMSTEELFAETIKGLQGMEEGAERTALASELLGGSAKELGALLNMSAEDTDNMMEQVHELGGVMSDEAVKASAQYADSLQNLQTVMSGLQHGTFAEFLPSVVDIMDGLTAIFSGDSGSGIALINQGVEKFIEQMNATLPKIMDIGGKIILGLIEAIVTNLPSLVEEGTTVIIEFIQGLIGMLPKIVTAGVQVIVALIKGIGQALPQLIPAVVEAILEIVQALIDNIDLLIDGVLTFMQGFVDGIIEAIPIIVEALPDLIEALIDGILGAIPQIIDAGIKLLTSLIEALPDIIVAIVQKLPEIIDGIISGLLEHLPEIIQAGVELLVALISNTPKIVIEIVKRLPEIIVGIVQGLMNSIGDIIQAGVDLMVGLGKGIASWATNIWTKAKEIGQKVLDAIKQFPSKLIEQGKALVQGLWQGISNKVQWIKDRISDFVSDVLGFFKKLFKIESPSKEMAWIGEMLDEGLAKGIKDFGKDVVRSATDVMSDVTDAFSDPVTMDFSANYGGLQSGNGYGGMGSAEQRIDTININVYGTDGQSAEEIADYTIEKLQRTLIGDKRVYGYI